MFDDSMLEVTWAQRSRRSWTTLTSFGLQAMVMSLLLLLPLWKTVGLPTGRMLPTPLSWGTPPGPAPHVQRQHSTPRIAQSNLADNILIAPHQVPPHVAMIDETTAPPQLSYNDVGVDGGTGTGSRNGVWRSIINLVGPVAPPPAPTPTIRQFRTSSMLEGSLIRRVQPVYPPLARNVRVQGMVVLSAIISKAGTIEDLHVLSGHPMLVGAAVEAVRQWRYRPYILNSEPVEVETQITVNFTLAGS
ncbi:MAG: energy transducer TonB [Candidatus Sulfotelmatobacter sp.]